MYIGLMTANVKAKHDSLT